jgi:hypothetical protein
MKSRDRTESYAQPYRGVGRRLHLDSGLAAARSKHSARLQRKLKAIGRDLSASRASDVIDKECCYAGAVCGPLRQFAVTQQLGRFRSGADIEQAAKLACDAD